MCAHQQDNARAAYAFYQKTKSSLPDRGGVMSSLANPAFNIVHSSNSLFTITYYFKKSSTSVLDFLSYHINKLLSFAYYLTLKLGGEL